VLGLSLAAALLTAFLSILFGVLLLSYQLVMLIALRNAEICLVYLVE
jgi:hypothetical protein